MKNKIVFYTAIFGNKDKLVEPKFEGWGKYDFICFTDNKKLSSKKFKIVVCDSIYEDPNISAKIYKILPHIFLTDYDLAIWIDGNVEIKSDPWFLFEKKIKKTAYVGFRHGVRKCIYEEVGACLHLGKGRFSKMTKQMREYKKNKYPKKNGLYENSIIVRRIFDKDLIKMEHSWWEQIRMYSKRDQLSLPYVLWKNKYKIGVIARTIENLDCFEKREHNFY